MRRSVTTWVTAKARTFPALAAYSNIAPRSKEQQEDGKR